MTPFIKVTHNKNSKRNGWSFLWSPTSTQERTQIRLICCPLRQHFNSITSRTDLRKYMTFKVVKKLNMIGAMKTFTKPNCNLCMEKKTILKNPREKRVTIMNKNSEIYGASRHKTTFHPLCLSTDDHFFNGWKS